MAFQIAPDPYLTDHVQVLWAQQFLTGGMWDAWLCYEGSMPERVEPPWEEFCVVLRNQLQDPVTRDATLARQYNEAQQRPDQTVAQFVSYLDDLEGEMEPYTDNQRRQHLLAKLRPDIRYALSHYQKPPQTRRELIDLATQLEAARRKDGRRESAPTSHKGQAEGGPSKGRFEEKKPNSKGKAKAGDTTKGRSQRQAPTNSQPNAAKEKLRRENRCYLCEGQGHYAKDCTHAMGAATSASSKNS